MKTSRVRWICSGLKRVALLPAVVAATMLLASTASAQLYTGTASTGRWNQGRWSTNANGPYTNAWVSGTSVVFPGAVSGTNNYTFTRFVSGAGNITLGNVTVGPDTTVTVTNVANQTFDFNGTTATFDIGARSVLNFSDAPLINTGATGNGLIKTGAGTFIFTGGTYSGGLTLNQGNLLATSNNLFGQGAVNINGGVISISGSTGTPISTFAPVAAAGRSVINVGGDFQLGMAGTDAGNIANAGFDFSTAGNNFDLTGATRKITIGTTGAVSFGNTISNGGLTLARTPTGTGQITITGANTYAGGTDLQGVSVLVKTNNAALGTGTVTLSGTTATTLSVQGVNLANNFLIADSVGTKTITQFGGGNGVISGTITNSDNQGGLTLGTTNVLKTLTISGPIVGSGTSGIRFGSGTGLLNGTVNLTGTSSYAGSTTIDSATLATGANNVLPSGASSGNIIFTKTGASGVSPVLDLKSTTQTVNGLDDVSGVGSILSTTANLSTLSIGANNTSSTFNGVISTNVALRKIGSGTLALSGTNTYTGGNTIDAGTLLGTVNSIIGNVTNNGTLGFDQSVSGTYSGVISGNGSLLKIGAGDLRLTGSNTYTGGNTLSGGNLIGSLNSIIGNVATAGGTLVKFDQATSGTYSGTISGNGGLSLIGTGTVSVTANQTYTGPTSVDAGTLALAGNLASGTTTVASGASLVGSGTMNGGLSVGGSINPGLGLTPGTLKAAGITLVDANSTSTTLNIASTGPGAGTAGINYDTIIANSNLKYGGNLVINLDTSSLYNFGTTFNLFQAGAFDATANSNQGFAGITINASGPYSGLTFQYFPQGNGNPGGWATNSTSGGQYMIFTPSTGTLVIVPEPSTWAMTLASVGFAGWMARRKQLAKKKQLAA